MATSRLTWEVEEAIVSRLFADMERLGWEGMTPRQRTSQYGEWIKDAEIGQRLAEWMTPERARVWIKDGPVKEYPRALADVGNTHPSPTAPPTSPTSSSARSAPDGPAIPPPSASNHSG